MTAPDLTPPMHVPCPKCAAPPGRRCRAPSGTTRFHEARWIAGLDTPEGDPR